MAKKPTKKVSKKAPKLQKETCTFNYDLKIEITQDDARKISMGGFMPASVRDALLKEIELQYEHTAGRERVFEQVYPAGLMPPA